MTSVSGLSLFPDADETIEGVARLIRSGDRSCVDVIQTCLGRIDEWEWKVGAWVVVDRGRAIEQARDRDRELAMGRDRGPLHGIPVGIKDIIDVAGLPTSAGSRLWGGGRPAKVDSEIVTGLRSAGTVILGKTVTTPYAWIDPPRTRNPWDFDRTPGGSSSGSAAAVASGMCLGAFGTQTGGSIIRPAAFCGVVGFKPSRRLSTRGVLPFSPSLDSVGPIGRSAEDARLLGRAAAGGDGDWMFRPKDRSGAKWAWPRIGRFRGLFEDRADLAANRAVDLAISKLLAAGAEVVEAELPEGFDEVHRDHRLVMAYEAAIEHSHRFDEFFDDYPPRIADLIREGRTILESDYQRARSMQAVLAHRFRERIGVDAFLTPAAPGAAPDRTTTGDPAFNSPWTFTDQPAISLPVCLSDEGLPLAVQLVHPLSSSGGGLLDVASWCEKIFRAE